MQVRAKSGRVEQQTKHRRNRTAKRGRNKEQKKRNAKELRHTLDISLFSLFFLLFIHFAIFFLFLFLFLALNEVLEEKAAILKAKDKLEEHINKLQGWLVLFYLLCFLPSSLCYFLPSPSPCFSLFSCVLVRFSLTLGLPFFVLFILLCSFLVFSFSFLFIAL